MSDSKCCKFNRTVCDDQFCTCDGCRYPVHYDCSELTASKIICMQLKGKRTLKFFCTTCEGFRLLPVIVQRLNNLEEALNKLTLVDNTARQTNTRLDDLELKLVRQLPSQASEVLSSHSFSSPLNFEKFIIEFVERKSKEYNLMIYNVPESTSKYIDQRIADDKTSAKNILDPVYAVSDGIKRIIRVGKLGDKPPPIKVIFQDKALVLHLLKNNNKIIHPHVKISYIPELKRV